MLNFCSKCFPSFFCIFVPMFIFILFKSSSWGHFFDVFFFFEIEGGSGPLLIFFLSLRWAAWGPKVCEGCRFFAFVKVVVDIAFGPQKPPKIDPLKLFKVYLYGFLSLPKKSKKFKTPRWAPKGLQKRPKIYQKAVLYRTSFWDVVGTHLGPQNGSKIFKKTSKC